MRNIVGIVRNGLAAEDDCVHGISCDPPLKHALNRVTAEYHPLTLQDCSSSAPATNRLEAFSLTGRSGQKCSTIVTGESMARFILLSTIGCLLILLAGCTSRIPPERIARDATTRLRIAFNSGCNSTFEEADQNLRQDAQFAGQSWVSECRQLREFLGPWSRFDIRQVRVSEPVKGLLLVDTGGAATFQNGTYRTGMVWHIHDGKARLVQLGVLKGDRQIRFPGRDRNLPRLRNMDPPPPKWLPNPAGVGAHHRLSSLAGKRLLEFGHIP
jgi:hypothetical protein